MKLENGYIQVYTGNGKGKTTCALGQGLRAVGSGLRVNMIQFLKSRETGELESIKKFGELFKVYRLETERDFVWNLSEEEILEVKKEVREEFKFALSIVEKNSCDLLILDEIMGVLSNKFVSEEEVIDLLKKKPKNMEIILTGRNVPEGIKDIADLVTEMKEVKHYFSKGVPSRKGIEF